MVFRWNCLKFEANIETDMEKEGEDNSHVNVIRSIDPSSNVTDCSLNVVIKLKLFISSFVMFWNGVIFVYFNLSE